MEKRDLIKGDVVQLSADGDWGPKIMVVTEPKSWGAQGYVLEFPESACAFKGRAYRRIKWEGMEYVGRLTWIEEDEENKE
jgi:hypothetical protein